MEERHSLVLFRRTAPTLACMVNDCCGATRCSGSSALTPCTPCLLGHTYIHNVVYTELATRCLQHFLPCCQQPTQRVWSLESGDFFLFGRAWHDVPISGAGPPWCVLARERCRIMVNGLMRLANRLIGQTRTYVICAYSSLCSLDRYRFFFIFVCFLLAFFVFLGQICSCVHRGGSLVCGMWPTLAVRHARLMAMVCAANEISLIASNRALNHCRPGL